MAKDLKSYLKDGKVNERDAEKIKSNFSDNDIRNVQNFASQYENMSENDMLKEISMLAGKEKKGGKLSDNEIDSFAANLSPMLNSEQKKKLAQVVKMLKKR